MGKDEKSVNFGVAAGEVTGEKKKGRGQGRPGKLPWEKKPVQAAAGVRYRQEVRRQGLRKINPYLLLIII